MSIPDLIHEWRTEAERYRRRGIEQPAAIIESMADELEAHVRDAQHETVTLKRASELSGYSTRQLRRLIEDGVLANVGRKNAPRIRIADLPRKPGCQTDPETVPVLRLAHGGSGGLEEGRDGRGVRVRGVGVEAGRVPVSAPEGRR